MHASEMLALLARAGVRSRDMTVDSRRVKEGDVFVAWPGAENDGRQYIEDALSRGAAAVIYESGDGFSLPEAGRPVFAVEGLHAMAGILADEFYGRPSEKLWLAGVTGTNGKTTVSHWIACALEALGFHCGLIGTLGSGFPGALATGFNTTPDAVDLHRLFAGFVASGARAAAMEVSSIGIDQGRVNGARFDVAAFTNLTRDHIDYHGTMQGYAEAKARFFDLPGVGAAVVNLDDDFGAEQAKRLAARGMRVVGVSLADRAAPMGAQKLVGANLCASPTGLCFDVLWEGRRVEMDVRLAGMFNASNLLVTIGVLLLHGETLDDIVQVAKTLSPPPGRMQLVGGDGEPMVIVDYAHTPDALIRALEATRETATSREGRLICVFGCGGGRDAGKRPLMGEAASKLADRVIVTSDNPRSEEPQRIIDDILQGVMCTAVETETDRAKAIRAAVVTADPRDVILVAGKGHELYQEIRGERRPFSDCDQAAQALAARRGASS